MKRAFVDTSAWFGFISRDDPNHLTINKVLKVWESRLVTTNYVLDETLTLVRSRLGHALAVNVGESLRDPSLVDISRVTPEDEENAWDLFVQYKDQDFSYTDCTSFAVMRRLALGTAITSDRHFRVVGFEVAS